MSEPEKRDQGDSAGAGPIVFVVLFMVAFIAFRIFVQDNPGHWLAWLSRVFGFLIAGYLFLWWIPSSIGNYFMRRAEERRERKEREEGLNGPSDQR